MFEGIDACLLQKNKLFCDYMRNFSRLKDFYPSHYSEKKFRRTNGVLPRSLLCDMLSSYNRKIKASPQTLENIERLQDDDVFAVISGQQPGLFLGPLYTIYKALSAIALAQRNDLVPIFWNASEDSDFEEVNRTAFFGREGIVTLSTKIEGRGRSISGIELNPEEIQEMLSVFSTKTPDTEFKGELLSNVKSIAGDSEGFSDFFSRLLAWLFGDEGLVLMEPTLLRRASVPLVEKVLNNPTHVSEIVEEQGKRLQARRYEPQLMKRKDSTNLYLVDQERRPILFHDDLFHAGEKTFTKEEIIGMLHDNPNAFSVSVALRPVVQDYVLPTAAYIAGPSEIAYFSQLAGVYKYLGVIQPLLYPRHSVTIVETKVKRTMEKYGTAFLSLRDPQEIVDARARESVGASFSKFYADMDTLFDRMGSEIPASLEKSLEATRAGTKNSILSLQKKVQSEKKREEEIFASQMEKASQALFPGREMQERVVGFMEYYNKYGKGFLERTLDAINNTEPDRHILLFL